MSKQQAWLQAIRLRTLPLSVSGIIVGSGMAKVLQFTTNPDEDIHFWPIFVLALITTIGFQILSNLSNDLGDSQKGTDNKDRVGPTRAVQSGMITRQEMKFAIYICAILSLISAGGLIYYSSQNLTPELLLIYVILAIVCVLAAVTYTVGKNAYGYRGLGDLMVFLFFGMVSVLGVFSLYGNGFEWLVFIPAVTIGLWSTAVLNLNNLRDHVNDKKSSKNTTVVKLGFQRAKFYHAFLILGGFAAWLLVIAIFTFLTFNFLLPLALIPGLLLFPHLKRVFLNEIPKDLDPELKKVALVTFASAILYALFINLSL
ncbi:MAG: 1,4-dihydroxy-2-naphthoate octaprenyltransferase [Bacteroidota bacterium]